MTPRDPLPAGRQQAGMAPRTRIGAYAWAVDGGAVLLCRIGPGEIDTGAWTLPGGGIDFGEHPDDALHREVHEETGLRGRVTGILGVDSRHLPAGRRPGVPAMHLVRIVYRMALHGAPRVVEVDGSVDAAAWIPLEEIDAIPHVDLVDFARAADAGPEAAS